MEKFRLSFVVSYHINIEQYLLNIPGFNYLIKIVNIYKKIKHNLHSEFTLGHTQPFSSDNDPLNLRSAFINLKISKHYI